MIYIYLRIGFDAWIDLKQNIQITAPEEFNMRHVIWTWVVMVSEPH